MAISVKVVDKLFISKPFIVAIHCGDSKPKYIEDYLSDFINEANELIEHDVVINNKKYFIWKSYNCRHACKSIY